MPRGPRGEKRPADAIGLAVLVGKIATGEVEDTRDDLSSAAAEMGRKGGKRRAESIDAVRRSEIARKAAITRWAAKTS
jgi:phage gp16-like protein